MSLHDEINLKEGRDSIVVAKDRLQKEARPNCKHCYGRGYQGRIHDTGDLVVCVCVMRNRDRKERKEKEDTKGIEYPITPKIEDATQDNPNASVHK